MLALATLILGGLMFFVRFDESTVVRMLGTVALYVGLAGMTGGGSAAGEPETAEDAEEH